MFSGWVCAWNQAWIDNDTFQAKLATCLLFNLRPRCPFICQARWFSVCLLIRRYLGQAVTADWPPLAERSHCFSHHIYSSGSSGGSTAVPVMVILPCLFHELKLTLISRCLWVFITAASPQLPQSDTQHLSFTEVCWSFTEKSLFFRSSGWEGLLLDQTHSRQPCTIWGMELLAQSEWSVLWGQSGEVLQVCCAPRNHPAHPYRFVALFKLVWSFCRS